MCDHIKDAQMLNGTFSYCDHCMNLPSNAVLIVITHVSIYAIIIVLTYVQFNYNITINYSETWSPMGQNFLRLSSRWLY